MKKPAFPLSILALLLTFFLNSNGQSSLKYDITYVLHGTRDTMAWLCQVYGGEVVAVDSCYLKGDTAIFKGETPLQHGVYKIVFNDTLFTDIIFTGEVVVLESYTPYIIDRMQVIRSEENRVLFNYWRYYFRVQDTLDDVIARGRKIYYANQGKPSRELDLLEQRSDSLEKRKFDYVLKLRQDYPGMLAPKLIWAFQKPDYRFFLLHGGEPYPSEEAYYRAHFFDRLDFGDPRMLYTEVLQVMINDYMRTFGKNPSTETYVSLTEDILQKAKANPVVYQYCIDLFIKNFEVGVWEQVFIHLVENHYLKSPIENPTLQKVYRQRVEAIRNTTIGNLVPDVCGMTPAGKKACLKQELGTRTLLVFWSPGCDHCEAILPDLVKINQQYKEKGLKVFGFAFADTQDTLQHAIRQFELDFINVSDYKGLVSNVIDQFNVTVTPVMLLLDEKGIITDKPLNIPTLYANLVVRYREQ